MAQTRELSLILEFAGGYFAVSLLLLAWGSWQRWSVDQQALPVEISRH